MAIEKLDYVVENPQFYFEDGRWYMDALGLSLDGTDYTGNNNGMPIDGHNISWLEGEAFKLEVAEVDGENPIVLNEYFNASDSITSDIVAVLADVELGDLTLNLLVVCQDDEYDDVLAAFLLATGIDISGGTKITVFEYNGDGTFTYVAEDSEEEQEEQVDTDPDTRWQSRRDAFENSATDGKWNDINLEGYGDKSNATIQKEIKKL